MGEAAEGRNGTGASDAGPATGTAASGPADAGPAPGTEPAGPSGDGLSGHGAVGDGVGAAAPLARTDRPAARARSRSGVGRTLQRVMNGLAVAVTAVTVLFAAVLGLRIALAFVPINPDNPIVRWIDGLAGAVVLAFRDLFLPADPRIALAVNYGLAAIFWLVAGLVVARVLRGLGQLLARTG